MRLTHVCGAEVNVSLKSNGDLNTEINIKLPLLPRWLMKLGRVFVSKTAGGFIKVLLDFVKAAGEDAQRVFDARSPVQT